MKVFYVEVAYALPCEDGDGEGYWFTHSLKVEASDHAKAEKLALERFPFEFKEDYVSAWINCCVIHEPLFEEDERLFEKEWDRVYDEY